MKKYLLTNLASIMIGTVIAIAASYAYAAGGVWNTRPSTVLGENPDTPINVSSVLQIKGCPIPSACPQTGGGLSVNTFSATSAAQFQKDVTFNGILRGDTPVAQTVNSTVSFGGLDATSVNRIVDLVMKGSLETKNVLELANLANNTSGGGEVCADAAGNLVLCAGIVPPPSSACTIDSFTATPSSVTVTQGVPGNPATIIPTQTILAWQSTNCTQMILSATDSGGTSTIGSITPGVPGSTYLMSTGYPVGVSQTITFTLVGTNATSTDTKTVPITVTTLGDQCPNISGIQTAVPAGYTKQSDGTCKVVVQMVLTAVTPFFTDSFTYNGSTKTVPYAATFSFTGPNGAPIPFDFKWGYCWKANTPASGPASHAGNVNIMESHCINNDNLTTTAYPYMNWGLPGVGYWPSSTGNNAVGIGGTFSSGNTPANNALYVSNGLGYKKVTAGMTAHRSVVSGSRGSGIEVVREPFTTTNVPYGSVEKVYLHTFWPATDTSGNYYMPGTTDTLSFYDVLFTTSSAVPGVELVCSSQFPSQCQ